MTTRSATEATALNALGGAGLGHSADAILDVLKSLALMLADGQTVSADTVFSGILNMTGTPKIGGVTLSSTAAELNLLSTASTANSVASKAAVLDASKQLVTAANLGTPGTGITAAEYGDGRTHQTRLTLATTLPAIAGGAALGVGVLLYTLPAGAQIIDSCYMSAAITQTQAHINADTPKVGLGTVIASGVVSVLNGTATFMNLITEQTAANCTGTATVKTANPTAAVPFVTEAAGSKAIYLNAAATWAASGDAAALLTGTVVLNWRAMA